MLKILRIAGKDFRLRSLHKNETTDEHRSVFHLWFHSLLWLRLGCAVEFVAAFFCG